jgi:hypothetical protein
VPLQFFTVTSTVPTAPGGEVAVMDVGLVTVKPAAAVVPKDTPVTQLNPVPVMVTVVPPAKGPALGLTDVTTEGP